MHLSLFKPFIYIKLFCLSYVRILCNDANEGLKHFLVSRFLAIFPKMQLLLL